MHNVYTEMKSKITGDQIFPPEEIPYIANLREWANSKVQEYEESNKPIMPTVITYKVPGSNNNVYTLTVSKDSKSCSCPGFTYRRNCKHLSILETSDGLREGVI